MKKLLLCLLLPFTFVSNAQETESDFIIIGKDTTFCIVTTLSRAAGNINKIVYTDLDGSNEQTIKSKDDIENVKSIRVGGYVMDYLPLNANKPDSYKRHIERKVDGKVIVYSHIRLEASTNKKGVRSLTSTVGAGATIYTIKFGKGSYYDITKKNIKEFVIPFLNKCQAFKDGFTDEVSFSNIEEAVAFYNNVCK